MDFRADEEGGEHGGGGGGAEVPACNGRSGRVGVG